PMVSLLAAFGAGVLSFLAPCVLPLVPGYLGYLAGVNRPQPDSDGGERSRITWHAFWFVLGFTLLYVVLGGAVAQLGGGLRAYEPALERFGGLLLIMFGAALTGVIRIPVITADYRILVGSGRPIWWRSGLTGLAFGASWSACTGPMLGAVMLFAAGSWM